MKRLLFLFLFPVLALAQTTVHTAGRETDNVFTGKNQFTKGASMGPVTIANLPISPATGTKITVSDPLSEGDCSAGGGNGITFRPHECYWNGNAWAPAGAGSGVTCGSTHAIVFQSVIGQITICDPNATLDGNGNMVVKSLTVNGTAPSSLSLDDASTSNVPPSGLYLQSLNGIARLSEMGVDLGHIEVSSEEGQNGGLPTLDNTGRVPCTQLGSGVGGCNDTTKFLASDSVYRSASNNLNAAAPTGSQGVGIALTTTTAFAPLYGQYSAVITAEANAQIAYTSALSVSNLKVVLGTATGGAQTVIVTLRDNGVDTAVTCTVGNTATTCSDTTHSVTPLAGHLYDWKVVLNSTTLTTNIAIGSQIGSAVQTYSGNTTTACSVSGTLTSGNLIQVDANGNCKDSGIPVSPSSGAYVITTGGGVSIAAVMGAANRTYMWAFIPQTTITTTRVSYAVSLADNSANLYDIGIYSINGTLLCHIGATAGTVFAPSINQFDLALLSSCTLNANTVYLAAWTGNSATAKLGSSVSAINLYAFVQPSASSTTTGGVLNGSVTPPAASASANPLPSLLFH